MKNRYIELERFIACIFIFFFHAGERFPGGWIFTEFFFLLTGCFTYAHLKKHGGALSEGERRLYPVTDPLRKAKRLLPYTTAGILLAFVCDAAWWQLGLKDLLRYALWLPANLLLLCGFGVEPAVVTINENAAVYHMIDPHLWYICCMLAVLPLILYLLLNRPKWKPILLTVLPLALYGSLILAD